MSTPMLRLARLSLSRRLPASIATFLAVAIGAGIVVACAGLMETGIRLDVSPQQVAGAPIVVTAAPEYAVPVRHGDDDHESVPYPERHNLDTRLAARLGEVTGVSAAVGEISVPATVIVDGRAVAAPLGGLAHEWPSARLTPFRLTAGSAPAAGEQIVLDAALAVRAHARPGQRVDVALGGATRSMRVSGIAAPAHGDTARSALFFATGALRHVAPNADGYDAIGVFPAPGVDVSTLKARLRAVLPAGAVVATGQDRGPAEFPEVLAGQEEIIPLAAVFGGLSVFVCGFVVAGTVGLTVRQRLREVALLRAIGASRRQVRRLVVWESVSVGVLGALVGGVLGVIAGPLLFDRVARSGVISPVVQFHAGLVARLIGPVVAVVVTAVAARVVAGRAGRVSPAAAVAGVVERRRWLTVPRALVATVFLAGGSVLAVLTATVMSGPVASSTAVPTVMCFAVALAALTPGLTKVCALLFGMPLRLIARTSGRLAVASVRARAARMAGVVTPVMLAIGIGVGVSYVTSTQSAAAHQWYGGSLRPNVVVSTGTSGFGPDVASRVRSVPGVAAVSAYTATAGWIEQPFDPTHRDDAWPVQGVDGPAAARSGLQVSSGRLDDLHGDTVVLPVTTAQRLHRTIGDTITLRFGDGRSERLRIVALFASRKGWATMYAPASLVSSHTTSALPRQLMIKGDGTASDAALRARTAHALRDVPAVQVGPGSALGGPSGDNSTERWISYLFIAMVTGYTLLAVINNLFTATAGRRRELGLHRLIGATRRQVRRLLLAEAVLVAAVGVGLGTVVAVAAIAPLSVSALGRPVPSGSVWLLPVMAAAALALIVLGTTLPTRRVLRQRPAEAAGLGLD